mgnify:CR=1 FL=1|tara:strand:- start:81719 stop:82219 length:501 start_codon:yes stop_codon:yes gene_type:complete
MENTSIVDVLIENITTDQQLLKEVEVKSDTLKEEKLTIVNRLKEQRKDLSVLLKYADEAQQQKLASLGFDFSEPQKEGNAIATIAFDLIIKAKDHQLTNEALYEGYVKSLKNKEEAVNYAAFNIKCRSLFNTQKLLRKKSKDTKSSKEDMISLNGRALHKESKEKS